jgi:hypothetical protein
VATIVFDSRPRLLARAQRPAATGVGVTTYTTADGERPVASQREPTG